MKRIVAVMLFGIPALLLPTLITYWFCPKPVLENNFSYSKAYFDADGELLRITLAKDDRFRLYEELSEISPELIEATILYEDQNYYDHSGIDSFALIRAFWTTYIARERRVGASTIVMQVARLRWGLSTNSIYGKIQQILRALQLSRHYTKQELLQAYLNLTPYGRNIEGIAAASLIYFNKKPAELSLPEALTLAVIPQNPNRRNPTSTQGYNNLLVARQLLFHRWVEHHPEDTFKSKFFDMKLSIRDPENLPFRAPHFIDALEQDGAQWRQGYVKTTLSSEQQRLVETILSNYVNSKQSVGINNASALLINYKTLSVEAMVGSADFGNTAIEGQVNGTTSKRSPGSTLKPLVYALALDQGLVHPLSLMKDSPRKYGGFTPENYDKRFLGPISVKAALIESRNVPAVDLQAQLKGISFYELLQQAGISKLKDEQHYGLALALGGGEVTSMELASLYAMIANGGRFESISKLLDTAEKLQTDGSDGKQLLSREASYLVLDMLKDNPAPDALNISFDSSAGNDIAWKTGTSWAYRDAWAAGISGPYVLVIWVGNFDGRGNDSFIGRKAAGPLFFRIMDAVYPAQDWKIDKQFSVDSMNLKRLTVCANTGDLYEKSCPSKVDSWFIPGVSPIKLSNIYRQVPVRKITGERSCYHEPGITELKTFEFWPSDFISIFNQAGISLKTPPKLTSDCEMNVTSAAGAQPMITSPQSAIDYIFRMNKPEANVVTLSAIVDPDVERLHWFINDAFVTSVNSNEPVSWKASPGNYNVKVVDDAGRSASKYFNVLNTAL